MVNEIIKNTDLHTLKLNNFMEYELIMSSCEFEPNNT